MKTGQIEPHYLPSLEYCCALLSVDNLVLEKHSHYSKQAQLNRCYINTTQGRQRLSVPIAGPKNNMPLLEIRIDYTYRWQSNHWRSIESAYAKSPYFEHYNSELQAILFQHHVFLCDLNRDLLSFCLQKTGMNRIISETTSYEKFLKPEVMDWRGAISPKKTRLDEVFYKPCPYYQVFGNTFEENLSVIDLMFCEGPKSSVILQSSRKGVLNK
jgi:WbqC-like protein family